MIRKEEQKFTGKTLLVLVGSLTLSPTLWASASSASSSNFPGSNFNAIEQEIASSTLDAISRKIEDKLYNEQLGAPFDESIFNSESQTQKLSTRGYAAGDPNCRTTTAGPIIFGIYQRQKDIDGNTPIQGYKAKTGGVGLFGDVELKDNFESLKSFRLGAGGTYATSTAKFTMPGDKLHIDLGQILGYASLIKNNFYSTLLLSGSESWNHSGRVIPNASLTAHARFKSFQFFSKLRGGYVWKVDCFHITPEASVQYLSVHQQSYTENDAGASNLMVRSATANGTRAGIGARLTYVTPRFLPEIHAFYFRDLKNPILNLNTQFASNSALVPPGFQNNQKNTLNLGAAFTGVLRPNLLLFGLYDFKAKGNGYSEHCVTMTLRYVF